MNQVRMNEEEINSIIEQTINGALMTVPNYLEEISQNNEVFQLKNPKEFVFGIVMGMALGMSGAVLSSQSEAPTIEDQIKVRDMIYKHIPDIRERIFS